MSNKQPRTFAAALADFVRSQAKHDKVAQECAILAMVHYRAHGNCEFFSQFYEQLSTNAKKNALVNWAHDMSNKCIKFADKKFSQSENVKVADREKIDMEKVGKEIMLTYKQEPVIRKLDDSGVISAMVSLHKRLTNADKVELIGPRGEEMAGKLRSFIEDLRKAPAPAAS